MMSILRLDEFFCQLISAVLPRFQLAGKEVQGGAIGFFTERGVKRMATSCCDDNKLMLTLC